MRMKSKIAGLLFIILPGLLVGESAKPAAVAITSEPSHHLVLKNDKVRVFKVEVAPHASTLLHQHDHDYLFVTLGESEVSNEVQGKPPVTLQLKNGEIHFVKGGFAHVAKNLSDKPFRNVTIELMQTAQGEVRVCDSAKEKCNVQFGSQCSIGGLVICASTKDLITAANFRVRETTIPASLSSAAQQNHNGYLLIAISALQLRSKTGKGKGASLISKKGGDVAWMPGGNTGTLTNLAKTPARFITLEFE